MCDWNFEDQNLIKEKRKSISMEVKLFRNKVTDFTVQVKK